MQELHHQTRETLECSWDTDGRVDLDEHSLAGLDVDLEFSSLVDGGVEKG